MATTSIFPSLAPSAPDESMEMSSPGNHTKDEDIDIDFDDFATEGVLGVDDERMTDDAEQHQTPVDTATDDRMDDDEELMNEDVVQDNEDDELIDYGEENDEVHQTQPNLEYQRTEGVYEEHHTDSQAQVSMTDDLATGIAARLPESQNTPGIAEVEVTPEAGQKHSPAPAESGTSDVQSNETALRQESETDEPTYSEQERIQQMEPEEDLLHHIALEADRQTATAPQKHYGEENHDENVLQPYTLINFDPSEAPSLDAPNTPTDTGLHPITLRFGDSAFPLFKSCASPDGLLSDDNLVSVSLAEMIKSCRQRIALKMKEDLDDGQEIVLSFDGLGLVIVEDCQASFESSLSDVLDVFLKLHENDGSHRHALPPLKISCALQLKFSNSLTALRNAAVSGQGMSSFNFLQTRQEDVDATDEEAEYYEHEEGFGEGETEGLQLTEIGRHDVDENGHYHHDKAPHEAAEIYDVRLEDHEGDQQYGEENADSAADELYRDEAQATEDEHAAPIASLEAPYDESASCGTTEVPETQPGATTTTDGLHTLNDNEEAEEESAASSTTLHGDFGRDDGDGKCPNEDIIDWDDDSDLTTTSEQITVQLDTSVARETEASKGEPDADRFAGVGDITTYQVEEADEGEQANVDHVDHDDEHLRQPHPAGTNNPDKGTAEGDQLSVTDDADEPNKSFAQEAATFNNDEEECEEEYEEDEGESYAEGLHDDDTDAGYKDDGEQGSPELSHPRIESNIATATEPAALDEAGNHTYEDEAAVSFDFDGPYHPTNLESTLEHTDGIAPEEVHDLVDQPNDDGKPHGAEPTDDALDFDDDIDFDDDTTEQHEARKASSGESGTPAKRTREPDEDVENVSVKKLRPS